MHFQNDKFDPQLDHLKSLFQKGELEFVPSAYSESIDKFLQNLPWVGQSIDWHKLGYGRKIVATDPAGLFEDLKITSLGSHRHALAFFKNGSPLVGGEFKVVIENIDALFWKYPGTRFVFGGEKHGEHWNVVYEDFMQYTGEDLLIVSQ